MAREAAESTIHELQAQCADLANQLKVSFTIYHVMPERYLELYSIYAEGRQQRYHAVCRDSTRHVEGAQRLLPEVMSRRFIVASLFIDQRPCRATRRYARRRKRTRRVTEGKRSELRQERCK